MFQFLGKSWIEHQFAKNLEVAKSELSLLAARRMKLHDREYIVFPEVWSRLNKAFASLGNAVISFKEMPDLNRMREAEVRDWVERADLSEDEKNYVLSESDKVRAYSRILDWRSLQEANKDFVDFQTYFQSNRIFLNPEIKEKFDQIVSLMREAWVARKMDLHGHKLEDGKSFLFEAYSTYDKQVKPVMTEIETLVQGKLFPPSKV